MKPILLTVIIASSLVAFLVIKTLFVPKLSNIASNVLPEKKEKFPIKVGDKELLVTVTQTKEEKARGLMGVSSLENNSGMLFILEPNSQPPFWMKNMLISIDIIWINDGQITQIHENLPPLKEGETPRFYIANDPVDYALEVPSGWAKENNIEAGTSVDLSSISF